jgi:hypothetical protein
MMLITNCTRCVQHVPVSLASLSTHLPSTACQRAADEALADANRGWQRRLRDAEAEGQDRLGAAEHSWSRKLAAEQTQFEAAAADWERWRGRVQDEVEAAQVRQVRVRVCAEGAEGVVCAPGNELPDVRCWMDVHALRAHPAPRPCVHTGGCGA